MKLSSLLLATTHLSRMAPLLEALEEASERLGRDASKGLIGHFNAVVKERGLEAQVKDAGGLLITWWRIRRAGLGK